MKLRGCGTPDCTYGDSPHFVPPSFGQVGFYACQVPADLTNHTRCRPPYDHTHEEHFMSDDTPTTEIKALEERLAKARAAQPVTDPGLAASFNEGATEAPGAENGQVYDIQPAADPDAPEEDAEEEASEPDGVTAFLVIMQADGSAQISTKLDIPLSVLREASLLDVRRACDEILFNLRNQAVSESTVMLMHQTTQQLAEQQRVAKLQQKLASKGINPGQLHRG